MHAFVFNVGLIRRSPPPLGVFPPGQLRASRRSDAGSARRSESTKDRERGKKRGREKEGRKDRGAF